MLFHAECAPTLLCACAVCLGLFFVCLNICIILIVKLVDIRHVKTCGTLILVDIHKHSYYNTHHNKLLTEKLAKENKRRKTGKHKS